MRYEDNIEVIKGIGEKTAKLFNRLGIFSVGELLEYFPRDYDIYKAIEPIAAAEAEKIITIEGFITDNIQVKKVRKLTIITTRIKDSSDSITVTWFNMTFLRNSLKLGTRYILRGKVARKNGRLVMEQPKMLSKEEYFKKLNSMSPIYPLTSGLSNNTVTKAVESIIKELDLDKDFLPARIRKDYNLMEYKKAIKTIHHPKDMTGMLEARKRIVFDEFFVFSLALNRLKENKSKECNAFRIDSKAVSYADEYIKSLPYTLTGAQLRTLEEIKCDMSSDYVANRLIQGDVGSGKTIVAAIALLMVAKCGYQGALMAPTEVLARQHYESFKELFENDTHNLKIGILTGSMTAKQKREMYEQIKNHEIDIIIGTQALIQEKVEYDRLALVVTDEQHRFGVRQRDTFSKKGSMPHVIVMSATPIPRTLAIILYGDLDVSIIDELPSNRLPIKNCVVNSSYRTTAYKFIEKQVSAGHQVYIICPMVEESEAIEAENVTDYVEQLKMELAPCINVEALHGKMKAALKNEIMERFIANEVQVLVSTTVIEVGVNVPNATVMMVENAERFGLAQLHQLRGRVGRGDVQSYCIFMAGNESEDTKKRLEILNKSNDGFFISSEDLKLRGPGDIFGIRQSGDISFKLADIFNDASQLKEASEAAKQIAFDEFKVIISESSWIYKKVAAYAGNAVL